MWIGIGRLVVVVGPPLRRLVLLLEERPRASRRDQGHTAPDPADRGQLGRVRLATPDAELNGLLVEPGGSDNFVGYRVTEKLVANVVESTATGRTDNVTGTLTIDGTTVSGVTVSADLRDLESDNSFRDGRIHGSGLESDRFPEAKFVLTEPITLSKIPEAGETITAEATGNFTLHGVTKKVTIPIQGRWDGKDVQIVGNLPIVFGDYNITAPTAPAVASVDDHGEMEFQLFFKKQAA